MPNEKDNQLATLSLFMQCVDLDIFVMLVVPVCNTFYNNNNNSVLTWTFFKSQLYLCRIPSTTTTITNMPQSRTSQGRLTPVVFYHTFQHKSAVVMGISLSSSHLGCSVSPGIQAAIRSGQCVQKFSRSKPFVLQLIKCLYFWDTEADVDYKSTSNYMCCGIWFYVTEGRGHDECLRAL